MRKKNKFIEFLQNYLEEENIQHEDVDVGDKSLDEIKIDFFELSKYFILIFNEFRHNFIDCDDYDVKNIIDSLKNISLELNSLNQVIDKKNRFGQFEAKEDLTRYIKEKYYEIIDFCNLYNEVFP